MKDLRLRLEGIAFGMVDRQGHRWRCLITDRVLSDAIGGAPTQKDKTAWFRANPLFFRSSVERVASNKFDMGAFEKDGFISITHWRRRGLGLRQGSPDDNAVERFASSSIAILLQDVRRNSYIFAVRQ